MKKLIPLIGIILLLIPMSLQADEIMLVGGKLDLVSSYNGDDGLIDNGEFAALTSVVRGRVRDQYGGYVNRGIVTSTGVCATGVSHGEYLCSEIYGFWTYRFSASGYANKSWSINVDSSVERKDVTVICNDSDFDGVCDIDDNCPEVPNGPREGTCNQNSQCSILVTQCTQDYCGCDCLNDQEIDPCLEDWCY